MFVLKKKKKERRKRRKNKNKKKRERKKECSIFSLFLLRNGKRIEKKLKESLIKIRRNTNKNIKIEKN